LSKGNIATLGGIYAIAFLAVMSMFAGANLILKTTRPELQRPYRTQKIWVILAMCSTLVGLFGNMIARDGHYPDHLNLSYFLMYFIPIFIFVMIYTKRDDVTMLFANLFERNTFLKRALQHIANREYIVFIHRPENIFPILNYIHINETGHNITFVDCDDESDPNNKKYSEALHELIPAMSRAGVFPHFTIRLVTEKGKFSPQIVENVSKNME
jgi:hypothetical protein